MPTYEYECQACHHRFEAFQSITAKPLRKCPQCPGRVKRLLGGGAGFLFRGSGFYITDYRSKGYQDAKKKEDQQASGDSEKSETQEKTRHDSSKTDSSTSHPTSSRTR